MKTPQWIMAVVTLSVAASAYSQEHLPVGVSLRFRRPLRVTAKSPTIQLSLVNRAKPAYWGCSALLHRIPKKGAVLVPAKPILALYDNRTAPALDSSEMRLETFTLKAIEHPTLDLITCTLYENDPRTSLSDAKTVETLLKLSGIEAKIPEPAPALIAHDEDPESDDHKSGL